VASLTLAFIVGIAASCVLMFLAGYVGDAKTGVTGNPTLSLQIESLAAFPFVLGMVAGSAAVGIVTRLHGLDSIAVASGFFVFAGGCLWIFSIWIEYSATIHVQ
jgi:hypothetical protein